MKQMEGKGKKQLFIYHIDPQTIEFELLVQFSDRLNPKIASVCACKIHPDRVIPLERKGGLRDLI